MLHKHTTIVDISYVQTFFPCAGEKIATHAVAGNRVRISCIHVSLDAFPYRFGTKYQEYSECSL